MALEQPPGFRAIGVQKAGAERRRKGRAKYGNQARVSAAGILNQINCPSTSGLLPPLDRTPRPYRYPGARVKRGETKSGPPHGRAAQYRDVGTEAGPVLVKNVFWTGTGPGVPGLQLVGAVVPTLPLPTNVEKGQMAGNLSKESPATVGDG